MAKYVALGAFCGAAAGYLLPPGSLFGLAAGALGGYMLRAYMERHRC